MPLRTAADDMCLLIGELISDTRKLLGSKSTGGEVDTRFIKELVAAMKDLTAVIRNLNELPTYEERFDMKIAEKKLKLDIEKNSQELLQDGAVTVKLEGELGEWSG